MDEEGRSEDEPRREDVEHLVAEVAVPEARAVATPAVVPPVTEASVTEEPGVAMPVMVTPVTEALVAQALGTEGAAAVAPAVEIPTV